MNYLRLKILLEKLKSGEKKYFDEFYERTKASLYFLIKKFFFDRNEIEDIMQEAYLSFILNIDKVKGNPLPYLLQTAKNKALDALKKDSKIDRTAEIGDLNLFVNDEYLSEFPLLAECRKKLNDEEYFILEHTVIFGYTRVEVSKMLNKPISTVNRKYNDILGKVKKIHKEIYLYADKR